MAARRSLIPSEYLDMISLRAAGRHRAQRPPLSTPGRRRTRKWVGITVVAAVAASPGIALAVTSSTASTTSNLVKNPGFESGTTAWHTNGSAQRLTTVSPGRSGSYPAKLTVTAQSDAVLNDATNSVASTAAGSSYRAQGCVRTATPGANGCLRLREVSGGTMVGRGYTAFSLSDTAWHLVTLTYAPVRAGSSLDLNVYALGLTTSKQLQVDDVSLMPTTATTTTTPSPNLSATATTSSTTCSV